MVARFVCAGGRMASQPRNQRNQRGRRGAILEALLDSERSSLLRQARGHSKRVADAEDALGDACVQFLRFYDGRPGRDALRWMQVVVKRCAWEISRGRKSRVTVTTRRNGDIAPYVRDERSGPAELAERFEEAARAIELLDGLKPAEREALILLGIGYSYKEIAAIRDWSMRKVNRCIIEGRAKLRELLERGVNS
ncbi:MAG TPA: RNA polymerase sigma factor [Solirubrobacterales bacterium]|jgi:RNA polymerase sigma factor (sigma-70 family)